MFANACVRVVAGDRVQSNRRARSSSSRCTAARPTSPRASSAATTGSSTPSTGAIAHPHSDAARIEQVASPLASWTTRATMHLCVVSQPFERVFHNQRPLLSLRARARATYPPPARRRMRQAPGDDGDGAARVRDRGARAILWTNTRTHKPSPLHRTAPGNARHSANTVLLGC